MTPGARLQAAIEVLDEVLVAARGGGAAADTILQRYFSTRRYAGSGDRRAVRDLAWAAIRAVGDPPPSGRAAMIAWARHGQPDLLELFGAPGHSPSPLVDGEPEGKAGAVPAWIGKLLGKAFGAESGLEAAALLGRAPLDLRVNALRATRAQAAAVLPPTDPTPHSPFGLRVREPFNVEAHPAYADGWIEVQDEGSQMVALAAAPRPGETVIDLCAGAGGKTLALAAMMANRGRIVATDTDRGRFAELGPRCTRAGVSIVEGRLLNVPNEAEALADLNGRADLVLVDAPCSGSGTWRRNPEARWRLTPDRLARVTALQDRLLGIAAALVAPGGRLVYAVCSVLPVEGEGRMQAFLDRSPRWHARPIQFPVPLTPRRTGTDGFFIGMLAPNL